MSAEVKARIAEELALLTQTVSFPSGDLGYGSDISCDFDVDPSVAEVDPFSTLGVAQSLVRRLDCPRGENPDDPNYGIGLRQMLNRGVTGAEIRQLAGQIRAELFKDDRVDSLTVVVTPANLARTLTVEIRVVPVGTVGGPFRLTLNASDSAVLLEEIRSER